MMRVSRHDDRLAVATSAYRLTIPFGRSLCHLEDADGRRLADLALCWSAHRADALDTTLGVGLPELMSEPPPGDGQGAASVAVRIRLDSSAWEAKSLHIECREDELSFWVELRGEGRLTELHAFAGYSSGTMGPGTGWFASERYFQILFSPEPHGPERICWPASTSASIDVVGGGPGRGHWFFTPPPFCFCVSRTALSADPYDVPDGPWLALALLTEPGRHGYVAFSYQAAEDTFSLRIDYEGHERVSGTWSSPRVILIPDSADPYVGLERHRRALETRGLVPSMDAYEPVPWWHEPIFCGWGAQVQDALRCGGSASQSCTQLDYDRYLRSLAEHRVIPGTIVIDDGWQGAYGRGEVDRSRWPDLRGWIAERHSAGQHVLLWWKAWDPQGLPPEWCVSDTTGRTVAVDPTSAGYVEQLHADLELMLGADGYDADGVKVDFTASTPSGPALQAQGALWGVELLHRLLAVIHAGARSVKPGALVITHAPNPYFAGVQGMTRLNDFLRLSRIEPGTDIVRQLRHRYRIVKASLPGMLIDTDDWQVPDRASWRAYQAVKAELGVPSLYHATHVGLASEPLEERDYSAIRRSWAVTRTGARN